MNKRIEKEIKSALVQLGVQEEEISFTKTFNQFGLDSLDTVEFIETIETTFNVIFDDAEVNKIALELTLEDIEKLIADKL